MVAVEAVPLYPVPAQFSHMFPLAGDAIIVIEVPGSYQPEPDAGVVVPPPAGFTCIVSWYCVFQVKVTVLGPFMTIEPLQLLPDVLPV
jgi:hypothetical protein